MVKPVYCDGSIYLGESNDSKVVRALQEKEQYILSADGYGNGHKDRYLTCDEYVSWHEGYPKDKYIKQFGKLVKIADDAKKEGDSMSGVMTKILSHDTAGFSNKLAVAMAGTGSEFVMGHGSGGLGFKGTGTGGGGSGGYGRIHGLGTIDKDPSRPDSSLDRGKKPEREIGSVERKYDARYNNFLKLCKALEFLQSHTNILLEGGPYDGVDIIRSLDEGYIPQFERLERDAAEWNRKGLIKNEHYQRIHQVIENELREIRRWKNSNR